MQTVLNQIRDNFMPDSAKDGYLHEPSQVSDKVSQDSKTREATRQEDDIIAHVNNNKCGYARDKRDER